MDNESDERIEAYRRERLTIEGLMDEEEESRGEKSRCVCEEKMRESEKAQEDRGQGSGEVDGTATRGPVSCEGTSRCSRSRKSGRTALAASVAK